MRFIDFIRTAITGLKTNKVRSFLTMLGIIIGISAVVTMMSLGGAVKELIVGQMASLGSNSVFIEPGSWDPEKVSMSESMVEELAIKTLKYSDAEAIERIPEVEMVAPFVMGTGKVVYKDIDQKTTFLGTTPASLIMEDRQVIMGRNLTEAEIKNMARVMVLGYKIKEDLFGEEDPIGEMVRLEKTKFRVVGVVEELGTQMFMNYDDYVYVPLTTAQKRLLGFDYINWIALKVINEEAIEGVVEDVRLLLRERHGIYNPEGDLSKDDFKVMSQVEATEMVGSIVDTLTLFLSCVAAIALVVGGIGIMNIMLVSVTERTREIGLRKAVGARRKDILYQFLLEAVFLTIIGGIIGIIFGAIGSLFGGLVIAKLLNATWSFNLSLSSIALAFGVATSIGIIFGIYPAWKAARFSPIDALRYE